MKEPQVKQPSEYCKPCPTKAGKECLNKGYEKPSSKK